MPRFISSLFWIAFLCSCCFADFSQAVWHSLLSTVWKALPVFHNKPSRNVNAAPVSLLLHPYLLSASYFLSLFPTIFTDFLGHFLSFCLMDCCGMSFFPPRSCEGRDCLLPSQAQPWASFILAPYRASPPHQAFCLHPHLPLPSLVLLTLLAQVQWL